MPRPGRKVRTQEQKDNLKKLADYLIEFPLSEDKFDMNLFFKRDGFYIAPYEIPNKPECDTEACTVGFAPITLQKSTSDNFNWEKLVQDWFGIYNLSSIFNYLFSDSWAAVDNTPQGAAKRIYEFLDSGRVPKNFKMNDCREIINPGSPIYGGFLYMKSRGLIYDN